MSSPLALPRGREVHVWHARLDDAALADGEAWACLSRAERERAARFHFERHRRRFLASHAFLRALLGRYLDRPAAAVELGEARGGKPRLAADAGDVRFNLSHSGEVAMAVLASGREVGADVESLADRPRPLQPLGPRVLSRAELAQLAAAEPSERQRAFLRAWTRKEAVLKAGGSGIDRNLSEVEVGIEAVERLVELTAAGGRTKWSVASFDPAPDYVGAVAAEGPELALIARGYAPARGSRAGSSVRF